MKGLGYSQSKFDSTWIEHSTSYDYLLKQLQQSHSKQENHQSTISNFHQNVQETKTRFSFVRLKILKMKININWFKLISSYTKQSSAKDLSSRSNQDLETIFGWNSFLSKDNQIVEQKQQQIQEENINENHLYTTSQLSIEEYFQEKFRKKIQQSVEINDQINSGEFN